MITGSHVPRGREALAMHLCRVRFPYSPLKSLGSSSMVERLAVNQLVAGSSPAFPAL